MTDLQIRRIRFDFDDAVPFNWNPANPAFSTYMNMVSIMAICFEKMIVAAVREAMPHLTDPDVADEAEAFLRQEAQHANAHRQHVRALIRAYPGLQHTLDASVAAYDQLTETTPLRYRLAYIADLEATFTPFFKMLLDYEDTLFRTGDDRVSSLFVWHFVEEVEHRSSALIVYDAVVGSKAYRTLVLPRMVRHLLLVSTLIMDGINDHVPLAERAIDTTTIKPLTGLATALRATVTRQPRVPAAFHRIPWKRKLHTASRVLLSQTPVHDPAHEPTPEFAERWFTRYDRGDDVAHWYAGA
ncbi:metal-dependent hydrolase [Mycolicibacterium duvalii]|uniref:Metal-dependent hydrolase n=1 Tax=Mycolicibacterium duvalii TaxID=39688 RepID=A0A7I7K3K8_9MYCO|nr:metal-dependent hydrolase [Mycolicibacterium duvalii]MCV7367745.1 metal-dependent hydrolase [Mycolicibacterium duvalii]PEG39427.1 metal-dependent hydrolase [Mycolicibacterium duvalii]BBX18665.1 metal-dependent hydrolase [Mycolicibacterium duvalii]